MLLCSFAGQAIHHLGERLIGCKSLTDLYRLPYKNRDSVLLGKPVRIRRGPATVSGEERSRQATGAKALGRQLRSDEP